MPSENSPKNQKDIFIQANNIPETSLIRGIRYLSCQGGGMKGIGEVGAVEGLEACGVLAQLEEVAGSSAGGLLASLLAIGCTAKEIRQEMLMIDFRAFQDKREPGWIESTGLKHIFKAGGEALGSMGGKMSAIRQLLGVEGMIPERSQIESNKSVLKKAGRIFSAAEKVEDVIGLVLGTELGIWEGEALSHWLSNIVARKTGNPNITFKELAKLADAKGGQFKKLTLTGANITDEALEYYNVTNTPDMPIVQAARISASFPGAYKPVIMIDELGNKKVKVDGGLLENLPDVFNKPPYVSGEDINKHEANPKALALVFKDVRKQGPKKIENGIDLAKALYSSKMSEASMYKAYGANVVYIDTIGMDTLEFSASKQKREALAYSGKVGVHNTFKAILEQEKQQKRIYYQAMGVEELVRRRVALWHMAEEARRDPEIEKQQIKIEKVLTEQDLSEEVLQELISREDERYLKRKKQIDPKELSDNELSQMCKDKLNELVVIKKQLEEKLRQLKLAKNALQFNRDQVIARFKENRFNNAFYQALHELKRMEENINENRSKKAKSGSKHNTGLDKEYEALKAEKKVFLKGIIKKYKSRNDIMSNFFEDVLEDTDNLDFTIPASVPDLWEYCSEDVGSCIEYINEALEEVSQLKEELNFFKQYEKSFLERTEQSKKYEDLLHFKSELDKTIYKKTSLLAKLDNFLLRKAPRLEKFIAPFLQAVAYLSFVCWLPFVIPLVGISKAVSHLSSEAEVRASIDNVVSFFSMTDIDFNKKLQGLRDTTMTVIRKMSDNYISADASELTYLGVLHKYYLEKSGIALKNIFSRNPNETMQQYQRRLENEKMKLNMSPNSKKFVKTKGSITQRVSNKPLCAEKRANKNFEDFREIVLEDVLELTDKAIMHLEKEGDKYGPKAKKEFIMKQQIMSIDLQYLHEVNQKLKNDQELTEGEVQHYLESSNKLEKELSTSFKKRYARSIAKFVRENEAELYYKNPGELHETEQAKVALRMFLRERRAHHYGKAKGKLETLNNAPSRNRLKKPKPKGFLPA